MQPKVEPISADDADLHAATLRLVAHDLNNPLTAIRILAEMLRDDVSEENRRDVNDILEAADLASAVAEATAERPLRGDDEYTWFPLDLVGLLREVCNRPALRRHVALDVPAELQVGGDAPALHRAFTDVLINGRRMVDGRDPLHVRVGADPTAVRVEVHHPAPAAIPPTLRPLLFQRHGAVALRRQRIPVSAAGLVDAHAIVSGHGGTISLEDRAEGGVTLLVVLPR